MIRCPSCRAPVRPEALDLRTLTPCPVCRAPVGAVAFPAVLREKPGPPAAERTPDAGAACFFHPEKGAAVSCARCGRFLCALCDIDLRGEHVCPTCIESGRKKGRFQNLENERTRYDRTALLLAVVPLLLFAVATVVTAPAALYLVIRYWRAPGSLVESTRWRYVVAGTLATLQIAGWLTLLVVALNA